ncbi:MAG: guanylate kinase [Candidatus Omnitrophota bacterium]
MSSNAAAGPLVWIVSGPSGSGKTTLCQALLRDPFWKKRIMRSVSYTTRALRPQEKNGHDYRRVTPDEFRKMAGRKAFLEYEKIFGSYYGTPRSVLEEARRRKKDVLLCIDVKGARTVRRQLGRCRVFSIFLLTPQPGALSLRLKGRSTEGKKDIEKRLKRVKIELSHMKQYDYIVVNDRIQEALRKIKSILTAKMCEEEYALRSFREADR